MLHGGWTRRGVALRKEGADAPPVGEPAGGARGAVRRWGARSDALSGRSGPVVARTGTLGPDVVVAAEHVGGVDTALHGGKPLERRRRVRLPKRGVALVREEVRVHARGVPGQVRVE